MRSFKKQGIAFVKSIHRWSVQTWNHMQSVQPCTLYRGCTMGTLRSSETAKTSASRWVRSRWALSWCSENSALRTKILAVSQSYSESLGTKMGLSPAGICLSCETGTVTWVQSAELSGPHKCWRNPNSGFLETATVPARLGAETCFLVCVRPDYIAVVSPGLRWASACHLESCATAQAEPSGTAASCWWCLLWGRPDSCSRTGICCLSAWSRWKRHACQ